MSIRTGFFGLAVLGGVALFRRPAVIAPLIVATGVAWIGAEATRDFRPDPERGRLPERSFDTLAGGSLAIAERSGRPLVLNLWATWCAPCRREMPMMMDVASSVAQVDMIFANQGEEKSRVSRFLEALHLGQEDVIFDPDEVLSVRFGALGLPTTLFFDQAGALVAVHYGEISRQELTQRIDALRSQAPSSRANL